MAEPALERPGRALATEPSRPRPAVAAMSSGRRAEADHVPAAPTVGAAGDVLGRFALAGGGPRPDELAHLGLVAVGGGAATADGFGEGRWM